MHFQEGKDNIQLQTNLHTHFNLNLILKGFIKLIQHF